MKTKRILTVLSAVLVAGSAQAAYPDRGHRYQPVAYELAAVEKLAHEVEDRARVVHRSAERYAHHRSFREQRALVRLHELEDRARHFHRQVERYRQNIHHTESDFVELRRAFNRASYAMHDLHAFRRINREFYRLSDAMYELEVYADDLFRHSRRAVRRYPHRRHRDWSRGDDSDWDSDSDRRNRRGRARIVLPRVRVGWDWLDH